MYWVWIITAVVAAEPAPPQVAGRSLFAPPQMLSAAVLPAPVPPPPCDDDDEPVPMCGCSYLAQPCFAVDHELRAPFRPYCPQPGDIMFATDTSIFWKVMHNAAGTGHPTHSAIVFARRDGTLAILEAGPHDATECSVMDCLPHLRSYEKEGRVWIRRRAVPLTPEQSHCLTEFCLNADGKGFALVRLLMQLTPVRSRGPVKTWFAGKAEGETPDYFCSELVTESCIAAGLLDGEVMRPAATYPRDLFLDASLNPYLNRYLKLAPCWDPPARWVSCPNAAASVPQRSSLLLR